MCLSKSYSLVKYDSVTNESNTFYGFGEKARGRCHFFSKDTNTLHCIISLFIITLITVFKFSKQIFSGNVILLCFSV